MFNKGLIDAQKVSLWINFDQITNSSATSSIQLGGEIAGSYTGEMTANKLVQKKDEAGNESGVWGTELKEFLVNGNNFLTNPFEYARIDFNSSFIGMGQTDFYSFMDMLMTDGGLNVTDKMNYIAVPSTC